MLARHGGVGAALWGHRDHNAGHSPTASFGTGTRLLCDPGDAGAGYPKGPPSFFPSRGSRGCRLWLHAVGAVRAVHVACTARVVQAARAVRAARL